MVTEKEIEKGTLALQLARAMMWDAFNKDRDIERGGDAYNTRIMREDIARDLTGAALEAAEKVRQDTHTELVEALQAIIAARREKEMHGKTPEYERLRDEGWRLAYAAEKLLKTTKEGK